MKTQTGPFLYRVAQSSKELFGNNLISGVHTETTSEGKATFTLIASDAASYFILLTTPHADLKK